MTDGGDGPRSTYRHGDLRGALLAAGVDMAREGGPDAVVLREATRRAGVSPNAAYRHFADREALLHAVSDVCLGLVADRLEAEVAARTSHEALGAGADDERIRARVELSAVGYGYVAFAREQPGLFRAAFTVPDDLAKAQDPAKAGATGLTPFQIVGRALDRLVEAGVMPAERRPGAEFVAWATVHGLGMLVIDGPLRGLDDQMVDYATDRVLEMVDRGLATA
ncbi:TetR family transcriptional regulator [Cnuibacter physcomitrellae]|uniref:TetR family transcriptional regulator n=1 Tax=Cnuibacter physcomitrellae TaxID=1619308 RepID=A0A1X9LIQ7_9MICO|nr:TetR/AcrR family transcriptional regulator [Cnuibacter physcomitrellae]ARJ05064.1 TetR family transcriptional regulator [Cnuibacter physcomitrellae]GGI34871.1 TetR family transcriptional regulator [Cnuibacter physcomitrellae]